MTNKSLLNCSHWLQSFLTTLKTSPWVAVGTNVLHFEVHMLEPVVFAEVKKTVLRHITE